MLVLVFCRFLKPDPSRSEPSSSELDSSLLANCGVLGVAALRLRCAAARDTDADRALLELTTRGFVDGVKLYRLVGGAGRAAAPLLLLLLLLLLRRLSAEDFLTGTWTVRVRIFNFEGSNMLPVAELVGVVGVGGTVHMPLQ